MLLDKFGQTVATCERTAMVARDRRYGKMSQGQCGKIMRMKGNNSGNNCHQYYFGMQMG